MPGAAVAARPGRRQSELLAHARLVRPRTPAHAAHPAARPPRPPSAPTAARCATGRPRNRSRPPCTRAHREPPRQDDWASPASLRGSMTAHRGRRDPAVRHLRPVYPPVASADEQTPNPRSADVHPRDRQALFTGNQLVIFLAPCAIGGFFILLFAATLKDRRLGRADVPTWSLQNSPARSTSARGRARTSPGRSPAAPCSSWPTPFRPPTRPTTCWTRSAAPRAMCHDRSSSAPSPRPPSWSAASLISGRLSDPTGRRKIFVCASSIVYGLAMFTIAVASTFNGFLVGMAISGLGIGMYMAVDVALVADVLPDEDNVAKDLGVFSIAGALDRQRTLRRAVRHCGGLRPHRGPRHPAREGCPMSSTPVPAGIT